MENRPPSQHELPTHVVEVLVGGQAHVVATSDADGHPITTIMTWVVALDRHRLAMCVDHRSRTWRNMTERPAVAVEILAEHLILGVKGTARVVREKMETPPFSSALVVVDILEVRDHSHPGTTFRGPSYVFAEDKQHRHALEKRVYAELRSAK